MLWSGYFWINNQYMKKKKNGKNDVQWSKYGNKHNCNYEYNYEYNYKYEYNYEYEYKYKYKST